MKQLLIMSAFIAFSTLSLAQHSRNWTIGANTSACLLNDDRLTLSKFSIEPGYQWNERLYVNVSFAYVENRNSARPHCAKFRGFMNSISISSRLLESKYKFSPLINLEFGNILFSNAKGATITRDFVLSNDEQNELMGTFSNFRYFGKIKYMLDIKMSGFNFRFGPTYSLSSVRMSEVAPDDEFSDVLHGFGLEAGLLYTFKSKKKASE